MKVNHIQYKISKFVMSHHDFMVVPSIVVRAFSLVGPNNG